VVVPLCYPAPPQTVTAWHDPPSIIVVDEHDSTRPRADNAQSLTQTILMSDRRELVDLRRSGAG
jgi:hypothetical protein